MPCALANAASARTYSTGAGDESTLAQLQLHDDRRHRRRIHRRREQPLEPRLVGHAAPPAVRAPAAGVAAIAVGERNPVDLGRERAEPLLVGRHLAGERHGQVGAAVEAVLEADDRLPAGERAGDLHRVLHRLRPAVHEEGPLLVGAGREPVEPLGQLDVRLVGGHRESRRGCSGRAAPGPPRTTPAWRCPVLTTPMPPAKSISRLPSASVSTAFSAWTIAIGVTAGTPARHRRGAAGQQGAAGGTGDLGPELDDAGHGATSSGSGRVSKE